MRNPFTLVFGKDPHQIISRAAQTVEIIETFIEDPSSQQVYMITRIRGTGKTVFMTSIARELAEDKDWVI